jgi:SAM-dependent methyltransferase
MEVVNERRMKPLNLLEYVHSLDDSRFDLAYPPEIRAKSSVHWTPAVIARRAAAFLVREPGTRVLDIGCGPGKFCIVGALTTNGKFTGVEQRPHLCDLARSIIGQASIPNAEIILGNITEIEFSNFDAFYLYNPFVENMEPTCKIDTTVNLSEDLYEKYTEHVARQLALAPLGTRVATYHGICEEVPLGYTRLETSLGQDPELKFWAKTQNHPVRTNSLEATRLEHKLRSLADAVQGIS